MSGCAVINSLVSASSAVTALVPAASIVTGPVVLQAPDAATLPAVSIRMIDSTEMRDVAMASKRMITERVQVTVYAGSYAAKLPILFAIRDACVRQRGVIATVHVDGILPDGFGPDLDDPGDQVFEQSMDLMVRWLHG